ncbi:hypothetical protein JTB14_025526 [Gonioctena quinquepunctata]|nr:hypothetical protein JTB14_025526 [Gonioctena quinquepunctata]
MHIGELQERTKWKIHYDDLKEGALILVKKDSQPPTEWNELDELRKFTLGQTESDEKRLYDRIRNNQKVVCENMSIAT